MAYCHQCAKLEDAAEAATLEYEELTVQASAGQDAVSKAREKRDQLRQQLAEHKATAHPAGSSAGSGGVV